MLALLAALLVSAYPATVVKVVDGDSVIVDVPAWAETPFHRMSIRVVGIDTPEKRRPPAKCAAEVRLGLAASAYARTLALPDGRDWGALMIAGGYARPYDGGRKSSWCPARKVARP